MGVHVQSRVYIVVPHQVLDAFDVGFVVDQCCAECVPENVRGYANFESWVDYLVSCHDSFELVVYI